MPSGPVVGGTMEVLASGAISNGPLDPSPAVVDVTMTAAIANGIG